MGFITIALVLSLINVTDHKLFLMSTDWLSQFVPAFVVLSIVPLLPTHQPVVLLIKLIEKRGSVEPVVWEVQLFPLLVV